MKGQVCEDAFDYWSNAVNEADGARSVFQRPDARPEPSIRTRSPPGFEPKPGYGGQTHNGFVPPPGYDSRPKPAVEPKQSFGTGRRSPPGFESRPEPGLRSPPGFEEAKADPAMRSVQGAEPIPPPNLPGLELLRRERRVENKCEYFEHDKTRNTQEKKCLFIRGIRSPNARPLKTIFAR